MAVCGRLQLSWLMAILFAVLVALAGAVEEAGMLRREASFAVASGGRMSSVKGKKHENLIADEPDEGKSFDEGSGSDNPEPPGANSPPGGDAGDEGPHVDDANPDDGAIDKSADPSEAPGSTGEKDAGGEYTNKALDAAPPGDAAKDGSDDSGTSPPSAGGDAAAGDSTDSPESPGAGAESESEPTIPPLPADDSRSGGKDEVAEEASKQAVEDTGINSEDDKPQDEPQEHTDGTLEEAGEAWKDNSESNDQHSAEGSTRTPPPGVQAAQPPGSLIEKKGDSLLSGALAINDTADDDGIDLMGIQKELAESDGIIARLRKEAGKNGTDDTLPTSDTATSVSPVEPSLLESMAPTSEVGSPAADDGIFKIADKDHNGFLEATEMADVMERAGIHPSDFDWRYFDADKDGKLSPAEFFASGPAAEEASFPQERQVFKAADVDHNGFLETNEMKDLLHHAGIEHFDWRPFDHDKDSRLSLLEFLAAGPSAAASKEELRKAASLMEHDSHPESASEDTHSSDAREDPKKGYGPDDEAVWAETDANKDGFAQRAEVEKLLKNASITGVDWKHFDADGDGQLSKSEFMDFSEVAKGKASDSYRKHIMKAIGEDPNDLPPDEAMAEQKGIAERQSSGASQSAAAGKS